MPDIISVIARRWKLLFSLTLAATLLAYIATLVSPKLYVGIATALPVNTVLNDKARIFNTNIEALYPQLGSPDELDKIEGTTRLDTIFIAVVTDFNLAAHYQLDTTANDVLEKAVSKLKKNAAIRRTAYGELQIKVWDKNNVIAAGLANSLVQKINSTYQRIQNENNRMVLEKIKEEYEEKQKELIGINSQISTYQSASDTFYTQHKPIAPGVLKDIIITTSALKEQLQQYQKLIYEYELAIKTNANVLTFVEHARPLHTADKPKTVQTVLLAFFASLLFSFLLILFVESRKTDL